MSSTIDENQQFIDPLTSTPIVNGYIYIGANGLDAELNAITIYSDRDLTTPLSNPQRTDSSGRSVNKIWVPGRYSMKVTDSADVQKLNDLDLGELAATGTTLLTNVQGTNTITAEGSPTITTLTDGQLYVFTTILANTGPVTLQIDSTTAYPITKNHDVALVADDFEASQMIVAAWNSTDSVFELQGHVAYLGIDVDGNEIILDADGDTSITADTDDQIDFRVGGSDVVSLNSTGILDANKNELISVSATASAVNEVTIANAATGNAPDISATGADTNIDITLTPKGDGSVVISTTSETIISGSAASTITLSGLDSTYTAGYIVDGIIIGATNGTLDLVVDSDTTATNYWKFWASLDSTYSSTTANDNILNTIAGSPRNYPFSCTVVQDATTGQTEIIGTIGDTRGLSRLIQFAVTYTVTDNITSIGFDAGAAAIGVGSFMRVRRVI